MKLQLPSFHPQGYTRLVKRLRIALPIMAVLMLAVVVIWPHFDPAQAPKRHANAAPPEMNNSHFAGIDKKNRPYTIVAERAVQKTTSSNDVDLIKPVARLILQNGAWVSLSADQGQYRQDPGLITLEGDVKLTHQNGYVVTTSAASMDLSNGTAWGDKHTKGEGQRGEVEGDGFKLVQDGEKIIFTGNSRLLLLPDQDNDDQQTDPAKTGVVSQ